MPNTNPHPVYNLTLIKTLTLNPMLNIKKHFYPWELNNILTTPWVPATTVSAQQEVPTSIEISERTHRVNSVLQSEYEFIFLTFFNNTKK